MTAQNQTANLQQINETVTHLTAAVEDLGQYFLDENGKLPQPPATDNPMDPGYQMYMQKLMESAFLSAGQVVVDAAVLVIACVVTPISFAVP